MALKHHNHDYDGGSPNLPLAVGDRYYAQDLGRDFHFMDQQAALVADLIGASPVLVRGGGIIRGSGDTVSISEQVGYVYFDVTVRDSVAIPPTTTTEKRLVRVVCPALNDQSTSGATLDGTTWNYVKLRYAETNASSRPRAKKTGSYYSEKVPSYSLVINSTAPTDYDVLVGRFRGTTGNPWDIIPATAHIQIVKAGEALSAGDLVMLSLGYNMKAFKPLTQIANLAISATFIDYGGKHSHDLCYHDGQMLWGVVGVTVTGSKPHVWIGAVKDGGVTSLMTSADVDSNVTGSTNVTFRWLTDGYFLIVWLDTTAGNMVYRLGRWVAGSGVTWQTSKTTIETCTYGILEAVRVAENVVFYAWRNSTTTRGRAIVLKRSGAAISVGTIADLKSGADLSYYRLAPLFPLAKDSDAFVGCAALWCDATNTRTDTACIVINLSTLAFVSSVYYQIAASLSNDHLLAGSGRGVAQAHALCGGTSYISRWSCSIRGTSTIAMYPQKNLGLGAAIPYVAHHHQWDGLEGPGVFPSGQFTASAQQEAVLIDPQRESQRFWLMYATQPLITQMTMIGNTLFCVHSDASSYLRAVMWTLPVEGAELWRVAASASAGDWIILSRDFLPISTDLLPAGLFGAGVFGRLQQSMRGRLSTTGYRMKGR